MSLRRSFVPTIVLLASILIGSGCNKVADSTSQEPVDFKRTPRTMERLTYPVTRKTDQIDDYHGTQVADPYRWLEDVDSAETLAWVKAQNEVTFGFLEAIPEREVFRKRLTELWDYAKYSAPFKEAGRTFYFKNDGLQNQSVLYVQDQQGSEPRVLLDPNLLSEDGTVALGGISVSRNGKYLAWATSVSGSDWRTWRIRDVASGQDLDDAVEWSKFSGAAWDQDAHGFYYGRYEEPREDETFEGANYYQKLYYHKVGTDQTEDVLVYENPENKEWGFGASVTEDGIYLVITVWQGSSRKNRIYFQDLSRSGAPIRKLLDRNDASYFFLGNDGSTFFFKTNLEAPRDRVIAVDIDHPETAAWKTLIPESEDPIRSVSMLDHGFLVITMHDVASRVKIYGMDGSPRGGIKLPGLGTVGGFSGNMDDTETYYTFNSYLNPSEIYHYDFRTGKSTLFRKPEIAFAFADYTTTQVFYPSKDGTRIPMFLVHHKDLELNGQNPAILYGYGGFNISQTPRFSATSLPWLESGGIYAVACLRGGGEYGEDWHQAGMLANKQNVFDDFIAAGEYLISRRYTSGDKLAVFGGSNGGTLVGAVINQRPELFAAAIPAVGVMDMLRFQLFTIGWAWVSDYGSSDDPEMFPVLHAYSPYHNLKDGVEYPAVMVTTADHDDRVVPGHSFKYAARLQEAQAGNLPTLIRIQTKAGHGAGKPTAMIIQEVADRYAFLHEMLGMGEN